MHPFQQYFAYGPQGMPQQPLHHAFPVSGVTFQQPPAAPLPPQLLPSPFQPLQSPSAAFRPSPPAAGLAQPHLGLHQPLLGSQQQPPNNFFGGQFSAPQQPQQMTDLSSVFQAMSVQPAPDNNHYMDTGARSYMSFNQGF